MVDKGEVAVCMEKSVYKNKILELLNDSTTCERVICNPLENLQCDTLTISRRLNLNDYLKIKYHDYVLTLTGTMLTESCGLPKIHKEGFSVHPIISLINSPTYKLTKFLYEDLKEAFPLPASHVNNIFEFVSKIKTLKIDSNDCLISLDATSSFTNITYEQVLKSLE